MSTTVTYPLRLPRSIKAAADQLAKAEGISLNQLVSTAIAEKLDTLKTAVFFAERRDRADLVAFRRIVTRPGGQPPQAGGPRAGTIRGGSAGSPIWVRIRRTGAVSVMKATMRTVSAISWIAAVLVHRASVRSGSVAEGHPPAEAP